MKWLPILLIFFSLSILSFAQSKHPLGAFFNNDPNYKSSLSKSVKVDGVNLLSSDSFFLNTPPIGDQGSMGSCVAWAVGYTFGSTKLFGNKTTVWKNTNELSPSFIFNTSHKIAVMLRVRITIDCALAGMQVYDAANILALQGACTSGSMPYVDGDCISQPNDQQKAEASKNSSVFKPSQPQVVTAGLLLDISMIKPVDPTNVENLKYLLTSSNAPIIVVYEVNASFDSVWNNGGIWKISYGPIRGGHCVCIVGFCDKRQMFKVQNQWGISGGDKGFFWVTYDLVRSGCFKEAYYASK